MMPVKGGLRCSRQIPGISRLCPCGRESPDGGRRGLRRERQVVNRLPRAKRLLRTLHLTQMKLAELAVLGANPTHRTGD
jgi:hypothetical protein